MSSLASSYAALVQSSTPSPLESDGADIQSAINDELMGAIAHQQAILQASAAALGIGGATGATGATGSTAATSTDPLAALNAQLQSVINGGSGAGNTPPTSSGSPSGINTPANNKTIPGFPSFLRLAAFVSGLGLLLIGVWFLRPVQSAVATTVKGISKGAALFA